MDDWALRDNNDSPVGVNGGGGGGGFVDNMQLLWKLQSLEPLLGTDENDASQSAFDFNQSSSTSDLPDDDDLVDKLFRESLAMQQDIQPIHNNDHQHQDTNHNNDNINNNSNSTSNSAVLNNGLILLSSPPINNMMQQQQQQDAPVMIRKRSRSPVNNHDHSERQQHHSFYASSPIQLHQSSSTSNMDNSSPFRQPAQIIQHNSPAAAKSEIGSIAAPSPSPSPIINTPQLHQQQHIHFERQQNAQLQQKQLHQQQIQFKEQYERQQKEQYERQQKEQYERQQKEQYERQQKEQYERQKKEQYEKQQRELYEKQQREQYERQQREQYEKQQREQYEKQQREQYEKQQREQYEKQQREQYERQQKEQYERQQQKELYERQQKEQYERMKKEQYERQQKELYERQQKEQFERQQKELYERQKKEQQLKENQQQQQQHQQQQQQQNLQQQKLQFERQQQEQTKLQFERQHQQEQTKLQFERQNQHHNQQQHQQQHTFHHHHSQQQQPPHEQKKLHQQKLQFERQSTPVSTFASTSPANTVVPAAAAPPPVATNSIIAQFPISSASSTANISSSPTIKTSSPVKPIMVKTAPTSNTPPSHPPQQQQQRITQQQSSATTVTTQHLAPITAPVVVPTPPLPPPPPVIPPRPQLRIHFTKNSERLESVIFDDPKDPMKPDLDVNNLRKLTIATLRTLGVYLSFEELPSVDIEEPLTTDSQQVLPAAAMQLITTMVLGTSGDKDVSQTMGSQISNGDLVALQRMIVAGLRSKNIVIHTVLTDQPPANDGGRRSKFSTYVKDSESGVMAAPTYDMIDLSRVKYEPPHNVTRLFLRLYRFLINMLLSTPDCWPFIQPVPETAVFYHQEVKNPMDLYTIEENVWRGKYTKFARFEKDMQLIWKNARAFHRNAGTIPKHADNLEKLFTKIVMDIKKQIRKQQQHVGPHDFKFDPTNTLPEESDFSYPPISQVFSETSTVYAISALSPLEPKARKPKGLTQEKLLYLQLNGPFFQAVERMKSDLDGNHLLVPRFYIAKNRTLLRQIRSQGVLAIFYNTKTNRVRSNKNIRIETDMILAYPASELFDIDQINECTDDFAPKGWIHLRPLRVVNNISFEVNETIERDYFRRMFATSKMATDDKSGHHNSSTKQMLKKVVRQILGLPELDTTLPGAAGAPSQDLGSTNQTGGSDMMTTETAGDQHHHHRPMIQQRMMRTKEEEAMEVDEGSDDEKINEATPKSNNEEKMEVDIKTEMNTISNTQRLGSKEISHDVWKKLFDVCTSKGVLIRNMSVHGNINWNSPNSEGFFKRVYFFDDIVVQAFRQMTMYQRITEVACLMKLRNLPHMAQMREVLFNDNGDVAGLSMERYQITLKQYTHVHSHHRLSAYQKYDVIYQMLICMKTIHEAGLAHRDLSEVNIMVNTVEGRFLEDGSEKVSLYLIDFGKAVFCEAVDVRDWFVDVPRAEWEYDGDVVPETKEELDTWCESLPWVKGKPDHGYRMYRSIQTLPKTRSDNQVLPWLIHPQAEDMYSIGVMIWKVFTDTEPWRGILDTDLQGLRYVAEDDYRIQRALEGEVHGELSRQLLLKCLKTRPQDRDTAKDILEWITQESVQEGLIGEWKMYSSDTRGSRRQKNFYGFEETDEEEKKKPRRKTNNGGNKGRGRPKVSAAQKETPS